jgi:ferredoxin-type protein NapH
MSGKPLPRVIKRRKIKWLRYIFQAVSFVLLVLLVPIGILAVPAGICAIPIGGFSIDCIYGVVQRIFSSPLYFALYILIVFALVPIVGSLLLGRAFCGLMCPIGTILDVTGKIRRRAGFLKKLHLDNKYNKYVIATSFAAASAVTGSPIFCLVCPIRGVCTAYGSLKSLELSLTAVPLIFEASDKRAWCRYFCPVGAVMGFLGAKKLLGFKILSDKCIKCKACMRVCPTGAITEESLKTGEISRTECIVCGRCYDVCMYDALKFGVLPLAAR